MDLNDESLLLEIAMPFLMVSGKLMVERQALNGLRCWSDNFERLTVCAPVLTDDEVLGAPIVWDDPTDLLAHRNITLIPLPWGYKFFDFLKFRKSVVRIFEEQIKQHRYLCFANFGVMGSWANEAAQVAIELKREYSVWCDVVVHEMPKSSLDKSVKAKIRNWINIRYSKYQTYR